MRGVPLGEEEDERGEEYSQEGMKVTMPMEEQMPNLSLPHHSPLHTHRHTRIWDAASAKGRIVACVYSTVVRTVVPVKFGIYEGGGLLSKLGPWQLQESTMAAGGCEGSSAALGKQGVQRASLQTSLSVESA